MDPRVKPRVTIEKAGYLLCNTLTRHSRRMSAYDEGGEAVRGKGDGIKSRER